MPVDDELVRAAVAEVDRRWPDQDGVGAALRLDDGSVRTGVPLANVNAAMTLCAETGPICTAYTDRRTVVASVCVSVERPAGRVVVFAPCGACQERLALRGPQVEVGVTDPQSPAGWSSKSLLQLNPHYWAAASTADGAWPALGDHEW